MSEYIYCPECKTRYKASGLPPGRQVRCPRCSAHFSVPPDAPSDKQDGFLDDIPMADKLDDETTARTEKTLDEKTTARQEHPEAIELPDNLQEKAASANLSSLATAGISDSITIRTNTDISAADTKSMLDVSDKSPQLSVRDILINNKGADKYVIDRMIGKGGMGAVVRAVDRDIRREIAMKILGKEISEQQRIRFVEEAQITGQLEHPNIVPVHELGMDRAGRLYFTMKLVRGKTLKEVVLDLRKGIAADVYSLGQLLWVFMSVCNAIEFSHSRGVVHRDLKPANIMLGDYGEVLVMDWGVAKLGGARSNTEPWRMATKMTEYAYAENAPALDSTADLVVRSIREDASADQTADGSIVGTPAYMSPEQALGRQIDIDERSDIYSLGGILYNILTLQQPFPGEKARDVLPLVKTGKIIPPIKRAPARNIPSELSAIVMKAMAFKVSDRYQSVAELRSDIELYIEGKSVSAKTDSTWEMVVKLMKRNKAASIAAAITMVIVIALVGVGYALNLQQRKVAEGALIQFQTEQAHRQADRKALAPVVLDLARKAAQTLDFDTALPNSRVAVDLDPDMPEARMLYAQVCIAMGSYHLAIRQLDRYLELKPSDTDAIELAGLCRQAVKGSQQQVAEKIAAVFVRQQAYNMAAALGIDKDQQFDVALKRLDAAWKGDNFQLTRDKAGKWSLALQNSARIRDLSPLAGLPITNLNLSGSTEITDLSPLKGMPLVRLTLSGLGKVSDLSPLNNMPITHLNLVGCSKIADMSPLATMPLEELAMQDCGQINNLDFLKDKKLRRLNLMNCSAITNLSVLAGMPLTGLNLTNCSRIADFTPLQGMPLEELNLMSCSLFGDISMVANMPLRNLNISYCILITDISSLADVQITDLGISGCSKISNFSPLTKMPLRSLNAESLPELRDLTVLAGKQLVSLSIRDCSKLSDLSPLKGMPLTYLMLNSCPKITDLSPLKSMPLTILSIIGCEVTDLSPLAGMELKEFRFAPGKIAKGMEAIRNMKSILKIWPPNLKEALSADEFWKKYDAGEFR